MSKGARYALEAYYSEGDSWATDRNRALRRSRQIAWWVAGAAVLVAILEALALAFLAPLKTVVPYTLLVDRQTGYVQALKPLESDAITADRALTQSFLVQYVIAREGFDVDTLQRDYRKVALWSAGAARRDYMAEMQVSNPESPLARLPRSAIVDVRVRSVSSLGTESAMVRYETVRRGPSGQGQPQLWVAVIRFGYTGEAMSIEDRLTNPLGFKVIRYRRSAEIPPSPLPTPIAATGQVAASKAQP